MFAGIEDESKLIQTSFLVLENGGWVESKRLGPKSETDWWHCSWKIGWTGSEFQYIALLSGRGVVPGNILAFDGGGNVTMDMEIAGEDWPKALAPRALIPFADNRTGSGASRFVVFGGAQDSDLSNFSGRSNGDSASATFGILDMQGGPSLEVATLDLQGRRASGRREEGAIDGVVLWGDQEVDGGLSGAVFIRGVMGTSYELFELPKEQGPARLGRRGAGQQFFCPSSVRLRGEGGKTLLLAPNQADWSVYTKPNLDPLSALPLEDVDPSTKITTLPWQRVLGTRALLLVE
jgi:hypothetical protein